MKVSIFTLLALVQAAALQSSETEKKNSRFFPAKFWPDTAKLGPEQEIFGGGQSSLLCPVNLPLTCSNSTPIYDSCCFESPGGIMLQTQFWDYYPAIGRNDSFTLHGLWPDNCDGSYEQFCDGKLNIERGDIRRIVVDEYKDEALFSKIEESWKNFNGDDELLWVHEFNKHATCIKTIRPECYGAEFTRDRNIYDFLLIAVNLYEKYPTFQFLKDKGIVPSLTDTYTYDEIAEALSSNFNGHNVYFKCNRYQALQEIWYFHYLQGPLTNEEFVQIPSMLHSNCPKTGIKFLPKGDFRPPPGQPPKSPGGKAGTIKLSGHSGCLISNGQWYTQGTCAKFQAKDLQFGGTNLVSSKGVCGVTEAGVLNCNRQNQASKFQFQVDKSSGVVSYGGKSEWCLHEAGKHGSGKFAQVPIKLADGNCETFQITLSK
ncbi:ribonuclease T2 [Metschnikowia bicuspidata var. bicuspidata NRRL YB-4993]|uniref:Ribonuclease T2-like n=1 Tax=Metschnikowia bicuspidata var. bicuspidata NRRL YB-4993 TaxID=869754 RepID=A0A1A0H6J5_9ASCO|nr:ribonuclease T2 [Metschnikowia bicuspidata var. bicuspidata NRRL YB-4993]OBA19533.1 ribonuclease T2 [Metschnikowia bicuspidata var. bicuspidata NRRL YB-4993]